MGPLHPLIHQFFHPALHDLNRNFSILKALTFTLSTNEQQLHPIQNLDVHARFPKMELSLNLTMFSLPART